MLVSSYKKPQMKFLHSHCVNIKILNMQTFKNRATATAFLTPLGLHIQLLPKGQDHECVYDICNILSNRDLV